MALTQEQTDALAQRVLDASPEVAHAIYMQGFKDGQTSRSRAVAHGRGQTSRNRVAVILMDSLKDEPKAAEWCLSLAKEAGVAQRTLYAAKAECGIVSVKMRGRWVWVHPDQVATATQPCKVEHLSTLFPDSPITRYTDDCAAA